MPNVDKLVQLLDAALRAEERHNMARSAALARARAAADRAAAARPRRRPRRRRRRRRPLPPRPDSTPSAKQKLD